MASPVDSPWKYYEKWLQPVTLIDYAGKKICHDLLFVTQGLPEDGKKLYNILKAMIIISIQTRSKGLFHIQIIIVLTSPNST